LKRLARRWRVRIGAFKGAVEEASRASDARPALYEAQSAAWEAYIPDEEPGMKWITVTTALPLAISCEQVFDALHLPRFACWLKLQDNCPRVIGEERPGRISYESSER
jgi:uncharacterized protein